MAIEPGTKLGTFEITGLLGKGGMGEVYRARDTNLGREVAIKVLPSEFAEDRERLLRFEREARVLASLTHPNIATLHDFRSEGDTHFLVMELVEGETLSERLVQGPLDVEDAVAIFVQIAQALEAAHEQGIVHRDLKPANIKLTDGDQVKVLDFGLAKSFVNDDTSGATPTRTPSGPDATTLHATPSPPRSITGTEMLVGTPAYMSPEQARGKKVDRRSDVWAFGCCLYQALTGAKPFTGDTIADTISSVTRDEPDWTKLPNSVPPRLRELMQRCLQKNLRFRLRDIGDAWIELRKILDDSTDAPAVATRSARRQVVLLGALLTGALAVIGVLLYQQTLPTTAAPVASDQFELDAALPSAPEPVRRYTINLPKEMPLRPRGPVTRLNMNISPDGTRVVYVAQGGGTRHQLVVRRLNQQEPELLYGTERGESPFFSPDGRWLGFFVPTERKLKKVPIDGGPPVTLCEAPLAFGASWGDDGYIYFQSEGGSGLRRISADGGEIEILTTPDADAGEAFHGYPIVLPGGKGLLFVIATGGGINTLRVALLNLVTGEKKILAEGAAAVGYATTGHLLYIQEGALTALPFDAESLTVTGPPVQVTENRMAEPGEMPRDVRISREGTLVFVPAGAEPEAMRTLVWVDRRGHEERVTEATRNYSFPRLSPDGTRLAVAVTASGNTDIWINDLSRGTSTRLTFSTSLDYFPLWSPDGRHIVFSSAREGPPPNLFRKPADGTGRAERLTTSPNNQAPTSWARNGAELIYTEYVPGNGRDVFALPLEGDGEPRAIIQTRFNESFGVLSPDGRWIAYSSDESGHHEVYVRPYPGLQGKWQISNDGGSAPCWSGDGKELFYRDGYRMTAVAVETEASFIPGNPVDLFVGPYVYEPAPFYDVSADGHRFLMVKRGQSTESALPRTEIMVVENWFEELKRLAPPWEKQ